MGSQFKLKKLIRSFFKLYNYSNFDRWHKSHIWSFTPPLQRYLRFLASHVVMDQNCQSSLPEHLGITLAGYKKILVIKSNNLSKHLLSWASNKQLKRCWARCALQHNFMINQEYFFVIQSIDCFITVETNKRASQKCAAFYAAISNLISAHFIHMLSFSFWIFG